MLDASFLFDLMKANCAYVAHCCVSPSPHSLFCAVVAEPCSRITFVTNVIFTGHPQYDNKLQSMPYLMSRVIFHGVFHSQAVRYRKTCEPGQSE